MRDLSVLLVEEVRDCTLQLQDILKTYSGIRAKSSMEGIERERVGKKERRGKMGSGSEARKKQ